MLLEKTWHVLLIHTDCEKCQAMMVELEKQKAKKFVIVVVPTRPNEKMSETAFPTFVLDNRNGWFAETPCVIKLSEGICVAVGEQIP